MTRNILTPAEAALLLSPRSETAVKCLEAGLLSLLSSGRIAVEASKSIFKEPALRLEPTLASEQPALPHHLAALEKALVDYNGRNRLSRTEVLHALQKSFGVGYGRYLHDEVAPGLIKRDLLARTDSKLLGLIPRVRYERTARGDALAAPLERLMGEIEQFPTLVGTSPDEAARLARSAGVMLMMSAKARRQLPALRKILDQRGDDHIPLISAAGTTREEDHGEGSAEIGDLSLAMEMSALLDGMDAVGDFTSGGDSSSSDGGDGGGGGGD
jgi:hypothetical protein